MRKAIAVDFDGTLCSNKWPDIGEANTVLIDQLIEARKNGAALILWTCREKDQLDKAVKWCKQQGLIFDQVNRNLKERIRAYHSDCRKISADIYIDDKAIGFTFGEPVKL